MIIDAKNQIIGRMGSFAAKHALLGEVVHIVNCEYAVITGKRKMILAEYQRKRAMGTFKGPFYSRLPDRFVRRTIRGMLPYKQPKGISAFKKIRCYVGIPEQLTGKTMVQVPTADISKLPSLNYLPVKEICKNLGGK
ncbi:50S ribosomal protein L13 [Candidatus Woesearchaeota archaeon]|nr:MAG: 50S ribosomal protein L13 [Candidatus Woesearchaeota archaeon]